MGVSRVYQVGSPYNGVELAEIDFEQTADTMYLAHIDHAPTKLVREGHTAWSFVTIAFGPTLSVPASCSAAATLENVDDENDGANYFPQPATYCVTAVDANGLESRASGESSATNDLTLKRNYNTVTWSAVTGAERYNIYKAENSQFFGYIGTTDSTTFRDDNIGPALDKAPPESYNPFASGDDYPSTVTLFEQRSVWGRSKNVPNGIWTSRSAQLENMDRSKPAREDDSVTFSIVAGRVNAVNQLVSTTGLMALTSDAVVTIDGDGQGGILTGNSPPATRRQIGRGSSRLGPLVVDNVVFYSPSVGSSIRTISYSFEIDGQKSNDVSIFSPHFFEGHEIKAWCYSQEPRSLIWAVRGDGKLLCFTWEQEQNVWGWTLCETDGLVLDCCCISEDGEDRVYLIVEREVNGASKRFVERLASHRWENVEDCCFLDCAVTTAFEEPQSEFTGLWHLEGRTDVAAMADGISLTGLSVTNGTVTLPPQKPTASKITIGIPFQVDVELLPIRATLPGSGHNAGRVQQTGDYVLTLRNTRQVLAGIDADNLFALKNRTAEAYDSPETLMTGDYEATTAGKAMLNISLLIRQVTPDPFTLLGAHRDMLVSE